MKRQVYIVCGIIGVLMAPIILYNCNDFFEQKRGRERLAGCYRLDLDRTDLRNYTKDILNLKNMTLELNKNGTFKFNMDPGFIYDSVGTWRAAGISFGDSNEMYIKEDKLPSMAERSLWLK